MSRNGYTDTERAQCVLCIDERYGKTAIQRLFMEKYEMSPPAWSTIRYKNGSKHTKQGSRARTGGNERTLISSTVRNAIRELFENNPRISLREVASEKGVTHAAVWNILRRVKTFSYKLQNEHIFNGRS